MKQTAIRELFSEDYKSLQIIPFNGGEPLRCNPRVVNIEFPEGLWWQQSDYKVTLEADYIIGNTTASGSPYEDITTPDSGNIDSYGHYDLVSQYNVQDASEEWSFEMDTELYGVFRVNHNVSAQGYRTFTDVGVLSGEAWVNARTWVNTRLGYSGIYAQSSVFGSLTGQFSNYNHHRTQNTNILDGRYSVVETWLLCSGNYYEELTADVRQGVNDPYKTVALQGTVNGLDGNINVGTTAWTSSGNLVKYQNASGAWNGTISGSLITRSQQYLGLAVNPLPVSQTIGHNFNKGVINYNFEFNTRAINFVSGAISETLSIQDNNPSGLLDVIGTHLVLNRAIGEILQDIGTTTAPTRTVNYECVMSAPQYGQNQSMATLMSLKPREQVNALLSGLTPTNYYPGYLFVTQDDENWQPLTSRYSRNFAWKYERNT